MIPFTFLSISHSTCRNLGFIAWVLSKVNLHFHGTAATCVDNTEREKNQDKKTRREETKK